MKAYAKLPLLIIVFVTLFLSLLLYFIQGANQTSVSQNQTAHKTLSELPVRLIIPAINVNAVIQQIGVTPKGEMEIPSNADNVGWFELGPRPGERGSAVIDGHFNGKNGTAGVFIDLYKLQVGDKLYVEDSKGASLVFVVRESRIYNPGYAEEVFSMNDGVHLNLVTCDGLWNGIEKSYSKRLVVFADIVY